MIANGAVVTSGGTVLKRMLLTSTELVIAQGLGLDYDSSRNSRNERDNAGYAAVVAGGLVGMQVFVGTLLVLGVSPRDRLVAQKLAE